MNSTIEVVGQTTKYKLGDRVQVVDHHAIGGTCGTVTKVRTEPDKEPIYTIRVIHDQDDHERLHEGDLEPDDTGFLDLSEISQIVNELRDVIASTSEFGLDSTSRNFRLITLGRIGFLAGRAAWLEAANQDREDHAKPHDTITYGQHVPA